MTAITINVPNHEVSFFKKMISKMGWTYTEADAVHTAATDNLPRLTMLLDSCAR